MTRNNRAQQRWWTKRVQSREVGDRLRIVPFWEKGLNPSHRLEVIIDPGPAFGSGDHPATIMALQLLEVAVNRALGARHSPNLLDVGTGTGVLAIAGKLLGVGFAVGLDIDAAAVFTAKRNLILNGFESKDSVELFVGNTETVSAVFDLVTANLTAPLLLRLRKALQDRTGQFLVLSGVADSMSHEVFDAYCSDGLELVLSIGRNGWNAGLLWRRIGRGKDRTEG